jgi:hypothetical protein
MHPYMSSHCTHWLPVSGMHLLSYPTRQLVRAVQPMHILPGTVLYVPGLHVSHTVLPEPPAYLPGTQRVQLLRPLPGLNLPELHSMQAESLREPVSLLKVPATQLSQTSVRPSLLLYVPEAQRAHSLYPTLGA